MQEDLDRQSIAARAAGSFAEILAAWVKFQAHYDPKGHSPAKTVLMRLVSPIVRRRAAHQKRIRIAAKNQPKLVSILDDMSILTPGMKPWTILERLALSLIPKADAGGIRHKVIASGSSEILSALKEHPYCYHPWEYAEISEIKNAFKSAEDIHTLGNYNFALLKALRLRDDLDEIFVNQCLRSPSLFFDAFERELCSIPRLKPDESVAEVRPDLIARAIQRFSETVTLNNKLFIERATLSVQAYACLKLARCPHIEGHDPAAVITPYSWKPERRAIEALRNTSTAHELIVLQSHFGSLEKAIANPSLADDYVAKFS